MGKVTSGAKKIWQKTTPVGIGSKKGKDLLFGKEDKGVADSYIDLDPSLKKVVEAARPQQEKAAKMIGLNLSEMSKYTPAQTADIVRARQERQMLGGIADQKRQAEQLVAQRGLGRSSVGLNAMIRAGEGLRERMAQQRAEAPLAAQQMAAQRLSDIRQGTAGLSSILGTPGAQRTFVKGREGAGRQGGLLDVALTAGGGILGGMYGGPAGAAAGSQLGAGLGRSARSFA